MFDQAIAAATAETQGIDQAKASIEGTGNKGLIEAMHHIVQTVLDKHAELAELQALLARIFHAWIEKASASGPLIASD